MVHFETCFDEVPERRSTSI